MAQTDKAVLLDMGFDPRRIELAVKNTGGLQGAMDWLEKHQDTPVEELESQSIGSTISATPLATAGSSSMSFEPKRPDDGNNPEDAELAAGVEAKSYKCNDCGKLLRSWQAVEFHASRTEHGNFEESTEEIAPLTEAEKKAKLEELRVKLAEKRKLQEVESLQTVKQNEAIRRKRDQDSEKMKEDLRKKEQLKEVQARKQEKIDDAKAKAKVKADIEATKQARRDAAEAAKAVREGRIIEQQQAEAAPPPPKKTAAEYTEARLQLNFGPAAGRGPMTKTFGAETTLFEVAAAVSEESGFEVKSLTTMFPPRKSYSVTDDTDMGKTLKEAGLTPSARLMIG